MSVQKMKITWNIPPNQKIQAKPDISGAQREVFEKFYDEVSLHSMMQEIARKRCADLMELVNHPAIKYVVVDPATEVQPGTTVRESLCRSSGHQVIVKLGTDWTLCTLSI